MKQLLKFSLPFILGNLLQQAYNIADLIIVGRFIGSAGLAAVASAGELTMMFLFGAMGFSSGGQIVIAQHIGAGSRSDVRKTIGTMFTSLLVLALIFMAFSISCCDWLIRIMNVPAEAYDYAFDYSMVYFLGMIPVFGYNAVSSILRGMGDSKHPFVFIGISAVLNVVLDLLFVGPWNMGCMGAALATVISQTTSFVIALIFLVRHKDDFGFDFKLKSFAVDRKELRSMLKMGMPLCVMNIAVSISMIIIARYINGYGVVAAAATAVGNKITMVATICTGAMMTAGNSMIGQNFAARKYKRVSEILGCILIVCLAFTGLLSLILILFPEWVFGIFDKDPGVLALSHDYVICGVISLLGFATRGTGFAFCNGIGNAKLTFYGGLFDGIIARLGLSLLFGITMGMGVKGFWLGSAIAGNVIGVAVVFYYLSGKWKNQKLLV